MLVIRIDVSESVNAKLVIYFFEAQKFETQVI